MEKKKEDLDSVKQKLRALVISSHEGVKMSEVNTLYQKFNGEILNYTVLGYKSLFEFIKAVPDAVFMGYSVKDSDNILTAVIDKNTYISKHAIKMATKARNRISGPALPMDKILAARQGQSNARNAIRGPVNGFNNGGGQNVSQSRSNPLATILVKMAPSQTKCFTENELFQHFVRFGRIVRILPSYGQKCATIEFQHPQVAHAAVNYGAARTLASGKLLHVMFPPAYPTGAKKQWIKPVRGYSKAMKSQVAAKTAGVQRQSSTKTNVGQPPQPSGNQVQQIQPSVNVLPAEKVKATALRSTTPIKEGSANVLPTRPVGSTIPLVNGTHNQPSKQGATYRDSLCPAATGEGPRLLNCRAFPFAQSAYHVTEQAINVLHRFYKGIWPRTPSTFQPEEIMVIPVVVDACRFWAHCNVNAMDAFRHNQGEISRLVPFSPVPNALPAEHALGVAQFADDKVWYRCIVLESNTEMSTLRVFFYDYGNIERVPVVNFRYVDPALLALPPQAMPGKILGLEVSSHIDNAKSERGKGLLETLVKFKRLRGTVNRTESPEWKGFEIEFSNLKDTTKQRSTTCIDEFMRRSEFVVDTVTKRQETKIKESRLGCRIVSVNISNEVFIRFKSMEEDAAKIKSLLENFSSTKLQRCHLTEGDVALYCATDNRKRRVAILKMSDQKLPESSSTKAEVRCIDNGNILFVEHSTLFRLDGPLKQIRRTCALCCFEGVALDFTKAATKRLIAAKVGKEMEVKVIRWMPHFEVTAQLFEVGSAGSIGDDLVEKGLAAISNNSPTTPVKSPMRNENLKGAANSMLHDSGSQNRVAVDTDASPVRNDSATTRQRPNLQTPSPTRSAVSRVSDPVMPSLQATTTTESTIDDRKEPSGYNASRTEPTESSVGVCSAGNYHVKPPDQDGLTVRAANNASSTETQSSPGAFTGKCTDRPVAAPSNACNDKLKEDCELKKDYSSDMPHSNVSSHRTNQEAAPHTQAPEVQARLGPGIENEGVSHSSAENAQSKLSIETKKDYVGTRSTVDMRALDSIELTTSYPASPFENIPTSPINDTTPFTGNLRFCGFDVSLSNGRVHSNALEEELSAVGARLDKLNLVHAKLRRLSELSAKELRRHYSEIRKEKLKHNIRKEELETELIKAELTLSQMEGKRDELLLKL